MTMTDFRILLSCRPLADGSHPELYIARARLSPDVSDARSPIPVCGAGVAATPSRARLLAVSETAERFCASRGVDWRVLVRKRFSELSQPAIKPTAFALYSPRQYARHPAVVRVSDEAPVDWTRAWSLTRNQVVLVPAAFVHAELGRAPPNNFVAEFTSTGFASHSSRRGALIHAVYEVAERDAVAIAWHKRLPMARVDPEATLAGALVTGPVAGMGIECDLYQVPTDMPFSVMLAVGWRQNSGPRAAVGSGCSLYSCDAAVKAVQEMIHVMSVLERRRICVPSKIRRLRDHAAFYATEEGAAMLRRSLVCGPDLVQLRDADRLAADGSTELEWAVSQLKDLGLEVLAVDVTSREVAAVGFYVVRVVIPGTVDICGDARFPRLGGKRLETVPRRLGLETRDGTKCQLNSLPTPTS